ncbi:MAG: 7-cyano-7-deazaguanine synthase, partial [Burkholderiaceae bacterium]|nr:7-cyano-7-deazaguanine synthase [Burkholderiaceae bacterium]
RTPHAWGAGCGQCPACQLRANGWERWHQPLPQQAGHPAGA